MLQGAETPWLNKEYIWKYRLPRDMGGTGCHLDHGTSELPPAAQCLMFCSLGLSPGVGLCVLAKTRLALTVWSVGPPLVIASLKTLK